MVDAVMASVTTRVLAAALITASLEGWVSPAARTRATILVSASTVAWAEATVRDPATILVTVSVVVIVSWNVLVNDPPPGV